jgi:lysophospholipase L1-like esterase
MYDRRSFMNYLIESFLGGAISCGLNSGKFGSESKIEPPLDQTIVFYGDSLTAGTGGQPYGSLVGRAFPDRIIVTDAIGGQDSFAIASRQGGRPIKVTITGNAFDGLNPVKVEKINNQFLSTAATLNTITKKAEILGVKCTIIRSTMANPDSTEMYSVIPDMASNKIVPPDTTIVLEESSNLRSATQVLWMGRNDLGKSTYIEDILTCLKNSVDYILQPKRFIILGILSGVTETKDTTVGKRIFELNEILGNKYLSHFVPMTIPTVLEMNEIGYVAGNLDKVEISNLTFPSGMRVDNIHLNNRGYQIVANRVIKKIKELSF